MSLRARALGKAYRRDGRVRWAFRNVDLELAPERVTGLIGRSGAGKSSLARCLAGLEPATEGSVVHSGVDMGRLHGEAERALRRRVQLVFQDAGRSFNPAWSARSCLEEPLGLAGTDPRRIAGITNTLAERLGLETERLDRPVLEFSGGQLRRLNLARALTLEPSVLILDEPFAGLDLSLQAQIANLLLEIQRESEISMLYISHDLSLLSVLADDVAVMEEGHLVETGPVATVLARPAEAATRRLVASLP